MLMVEMVVREVRSWWVELVFTSMFARGDCIYYRFFSLQMAQSDWL